MAILEEGTIVGRYRIVSLLGRGGMGEVYRATDTTLDRTVALKVLDGVSGADEERVHRFVVEARAASALNHPNIIAIHDAGEVSGVRFIASELVEGQTLRDRLEPGPLPVRDALDVAVQIASALAAAHAAGIVHRDIKPENVIVRPDGYVKVLDFGLAKLTEPVGISSGASTQSVTMLKTTAGMIMGTVAYMSPEQARGLPVDSRSDGFSLGVVLAEMLSGRAPFGGATATDVLVSILEKDPPLQALRDRGLPPEVVWVLAKALDKDLDLRYQSAIELRIDLERLRRALKSGMLGVPAGGAAREIDAFEPELTEDDPKVVALTRFTRGSLVLLVAAAAGLLSLKPLYNRTFSSEVRAGLPRAAIEARARDVVGALGHDASAHHVVARLARSDVDLAVVARSGLPNARRVVRDGHAAAFNVDLTASEAATTAPPGVSREPRSGDFALRLTPTGRLSSFVAGRDDRRSTPPLERQAAIVQATNAVQQHLGVDVTGAAPEYAVRPYPTPVTELVWRRSGGIPGYQDHIHVQLEGPRLVRLANVRSPAEHQEPPKQELRKRLAIAAVSILITLAVGGYLLGLVTLVRVRRWTLLRDPLSIGLVGSLAAAITINSFLDGPGLLATGGLLVLATLIGVALLPAVAGAVYWVRATNGPQFYGAGRLASGHVASMGVASSLLHGVAAGIVFAAAMLGFELLMLQTPGYSPSIGAELSIANSPSLVNALESLVAAGMFALCIALAFELQLRLLTRRPWGLLITALVVGALLALSTDQQSVAAAAVSVVQAAAGIAALTFLYRWRGFGAVLFSVMTAAVLLEAISAHSLGNADTVAYAYRLYAVLGVLFAIGAWAYSRQRVGQMLQTLGSTR
jgi:protein kinase-like protein